MDQCQLIWLQSIALVFVFVTLLYLPAIREAVRKPMTNSQRDQAPGRFAALSGGLTHYRWFGPENGPVVVCIHGLTTPAEGFVPLANELIQQGYRVLLYDLYGRGYSDYVEGEQDAAFFIDQLEDLLAHESVVEDITLIGYSAGGCIATAFAQQHLHRVKKLILIAPLGYHVPGPLITSVATQRKAVEEIILRMFYPGKARRHLRTLLRDGRTPARVQRAQYAQIKRRGFFPSNLAAKRGVVIDDPSSAQKLFHAKHLPVIVIWAEKDNIIPASARTTLATKNPSAKQELVPGAGHAVLYTDPAEIAQIISQKEAGGA